MKLLRNAFATFAIAMIAVVALAETTGSHTHNEALNKPEKVAGMEAAGKKAAAEKPVLTVYYFHGHVRCTNCINFERFTEELLKQDFAKEMEKGRIEWKVVNVDIPENAHFVADYKLYTKAIVLVPHNSKNPGEFKNLTKIWQSVGDKAKFQEYVRGEIRKAIGAEK
ncbi:MAG: nitrophenyl compound nitroreductase subunit ArsF family protein [Candidatus Sumerlaeaceae bacterium]|nr:nitrophenyl compound nitroreductase subunit ArsF family protein [Candidatus Sumerlaeaceae bacterium]